MASATTGPFQPWSRPGMRGLCLLVLSLKLVYPNPSLVGGQEISGGGGARAERAERLVRRGEALARGGNRASALGSFREAVQIDPRAVEAYIGLARLYRAAGRHADAHEAILVGLHRRSRSVALRLELATHQQEVGEIVDALTTLREVLRRAPNNLRALRLHLILAQELGAWTEALRSARRLLELVGEEEREDLALRVRALAILARPLDAACVEDDVRAESALLQSLCR